MLDFAMATARGAGELIMAVYASDFSSRLKPDHSPVTEADERAEAYITSQLRARSPGIPIVAEEEFARGESPAAVGERFWLVDALDGTREFLSRNGEFTVNIALIDRRVPRLGVVFAPASGRLFAGIVGRGAVVQAGSESQAIQCRASPPGGPVVLASRSHGDAARLQAFVAKHPGAVVRNLGSSLKFCLVAAGEADLYPRWGRTMEWDTAAGHAVLLAAGGQVQTLAGEPLGYAKPGWVNPDFIACGAAPDAT